MREVGTALITVQVQSLRVAVRAAIVREVLGGRSWIPVPGARDELPGVVVWAGRAVAVLDLARFSDGLDRLGPDQTRTRIVVVTAGDSTLALPVDQVSEVFQTHDDNLQPRQVRDFRLARTELVLDDDVLPLCEPYLLLERLDAESK